MKIGWLLFCFLPFCLASQDWVEMESYPGEGRHHPVTFSLGNFGYVATGSAAGRSNEVFRYDAIENIWERLDPFPGENRSFAYGDTFEGKAYLGFGMGFPLKLKDLWEYEPTTDTWTELASCPCQARTHPAFMALNGKIYVGLGGGVGDLKDWWAYDIELDAWERKADFPGASRHHPYFFVIDNYAYVGMGHGVGIFNDLYRYDPASDTWEQMTRLPAEGRVAGSQFAYNGKGYILSGQGEDHRHMLEGEFWQYDPESNIWTEMPPHPGASRWAPGSFLIDNRVYFTSGQHNDFVSSNETLYFDLEINTVSTADILSPILITSAPNPVGNELRLLNLKSQDFNNIRVVVFNVLGQKIIDKQLESNVLNVGYLRKGTYFLKIISGKEGEDQTIKFFKN